MIFRLLFALYVVIGVFVAAGVIGDEHNYFAELDNIEEILELVLTIFLWPLSLLDVNIDLGGSDSGGGEGSGGGSEDGGSDKGAGGGKK